MKVLFIVLLLAGCGSGDESPPPPDNHGYGFQADVQASGMSLRYSPVLNAGDPHAAVAFYQSEFESVEQCTGISGPIPPFVIVVNIGDLGLAPSGVLINGAYFSNPSLIVIDTTVAAARHEMIHSLLESSTGDSDGNHKSHFFKVVADGGCA